MSHTTTLITRYPHTLIPPFISRKIQQTMSSHLEIFISEHFKYPKGGGWDLDSLRADLFFQYDAMETTTIDLKSPKVIETIAQEIIQRYRPNLSTPEDYEIIQKISQVIYKMEVARLGL